MILTNENYHSKEANQAYLSTSQYKNFVGSAGKKGCEAFALAKINGEWEGKQSTAMLVGSYVDAHFEGTLDLFRAKNPEIFTQKGGLKSEFKQAEEIIQRIERDPLFMSALSGEKQVIITFELFGAKWKAKLDSLLLESNKLADPNITDLKVMKNIRQSFYIKDEGKVNFVEYWGYDIQAAIYQKGVELVYGKKLPFYIAAADKTDFPDIEVIGIPQEKLDDSLSLVEFNIKRILDLKAGLAEPDRCGMCDYCKHTKVLLAPIPYDLLVQGV